MTTQGSHPLLDGIPLGQDGLHAYFVHSYQLRPQDGADLVAQAEYGGPITAVVGARQRGWHAVSSGKEPETWACVDREFPEMEALKRAASNL